METLNKQLIAVDLKKSTMIPLPQFIQNDTNILEIQVKDNGSDADFTNIGKIVVNYKRPDKVVISRLLDSSNNRVTYEIGLQEMEVAGHAEVELQFFSSDALQRISTKRFKVLMYESIGTDNIFEDSGDLTILQELFVEVEDLNNRMELAESARESAETTRVNAESARTAAESDRSTAEAGRVSAEQARITAETARQNQESTRQTNEDVRVSQENARNAAEQSRQTNTQNAIDNAVAATNNANQAADNANSIANTLIHRGEYDPLVTYVPRNVVSYFGSGYMNIAESTGIDPTNSTNWLMVSSKGDQGIQGIQGEPGPKGEPGTGNENSVNGKYGPDIELNASDVGAISATEKGAPNGVPTLDENGKVPADQIDSSGYAPQTEFAQLQDDVTRHQAERATPTTLGHVKAETDEDGNLILPEMSASNVTTTNGSNVQMEINSLKSSVSNGKLDVRNAITGKGGTVADADGDGVPTHAELAAGVQGLNTLQTGDPLTIKQAGLLSMPKLAITTRADAQIQSMEKVSNQEYYWDWYYDSTQRAIQKIIWDAPTNKYKIIVGYTIPTTYSGYPWGLTYSPELDRLFEFRGTAFHEINRNDLTIAATITGKNQLFIPKNPNALYVAYTPGSGNQMKAGKVDLSYNTITEFTTAETQVNGEFGLVDNYFIYRMLSGGVYKIARINLTTGEKIIGPNYNISTNQNNFLIDGDILYIIHGQYIYKYDIRTMALISSKDMTGTTAINLTAFMNYEDDPTKLLVMFKSSSGEGTLKLVNKADYAVTELDFGATIGVGTPFKFGASGDSFITMGYVENSNRQFQDNLFKLKYQQ